MQAYVFASIHGHGLPFQFNCSLPINTGGCMEYCMSCHSPGRIKRRYSERGSTHGPPSPGISAMDARVGSLLFHAFHAKATVHVDFLWTGNSGWRERTRTYDMEPLPPFLRMEPQLGRAAVRALQAAPRPRLRCERAVARSSRPPCASRSASLCEHARRRSPY